MHNWLNTGTQKQKFHKEAVANCPICCAENETWMRMFQCPHEDAITLRSLAITKCIIPPRIPSDPTGLKLCNAVESQHDLGWNNFMKGRITKE
eukprot:1742893-Ditylum_brightwellii.AAC.1